MSLSQSVIIQPIKKKYNIKQWNEEKQDKLSVENFNKLDKMSDLFCNDQVRLKYNINKIIQDMQDFLQKVNLQQLKPPFLHNTFGIWRKTSFEKLDMLVRLCTFKQQQSWKKVFYERIDQELFQQYILRLQEPYMNQILYENYQIPQQLEPNLLKKTLQLYQELSDLSQVIREWCIQLEITFDIIDRVNLYQICNTKQCYYISDNIKKEFDINKIQIDSLNKKGNNLQDFLMKKALVFGVRKLQGLFKQKGLTWGTILTVLYSVAAGTANPVIAILIGSMGNSVVGNILQVVSDYLEKDDKKQLINNLIVELSPIVKSLKQQNEMCEVNILKCFEANNESDYQLAKEELKHSIEKLMENDIDEYTYSKGVLLQEKHVGEWNVIDYAEDLEEEIQGDFALIGLPSQSKKNNY
ncbi:hypothetical protein ABPG74_016514 [Tetrahymena malaccensis]